MRQLQPLAHLVLLLAALLACGKGSKSSSTGDTSNSPSGDPAETATPVDARTLISDYKGNEVRGDSKWKGKLVSVTGVVGEIKKDIMDDVYVTLGTGAELEFDNVHCALASGQEGVAAQLSKGQRATFRGRVSGMIMMSVMVKDCELVPTAAPPAHAAPPAAPAAPVKPAKRRP
jgi:tRNA_anti-like